MNIDDGRDLWPAASQPLVWYWMRLI